MQTFKPRNPFALPELEEHETDLTDGERRILARLARQPLDLYFGNAGWTPAKGLPKGAKRSDFDRLCKRPEGLVKIELGQLCLSTETAQN
ncbi:hypothetical protein VQ574_20720 (plasmid) [Stutzerimonas frequens]|uniref:hypothetical protein n=1 Tax=Stutzerimonas frequens TaxID=2968969 RepID=UPI002DBABAA2|nr:hypothetical protein [Stutzerimonas frequens]WRW29363.1 hypothetical protein VQ574_20720 [Stutzerimonas frequens]